jgi:hypothetical protein
MRMRWDGGPVTVDPEIVSNSRLRSTGAKLCQPGNSTKAEGAPSRCEHKGGNHRLKARKRSPLNLSVPDGLHGGGQIARNRVGATREVAPPAPPTRQEPPSTTGEN